MRQVNFKHRTIRLDTGSTKNREGREVTMTARVEELIRAAVAEKQADHYLLTREPGHRPVRDFRKTWQHLCVRTGLGEWVCGGCRRPAAAPDSECVCGWQGKKKYSGLLRHDFRRSAVRDLVRSGVTEKVAMTITGHKTRSVFDRYDIVSQRDIREAVQRLEQKRADSPRSAPFTENEPAAPSKILNEKVQ